jgi:ABC-2 type transport system ATP-binding protein
MGNRLIGNLSKGYQQRVGLAQAIVHMPQVLVLDEPGSGLDPGQTLEMRALIRDIGEDHCVILSTHILGEAQGLCDRILIINQGEIVLDRPLTDLPGAETSGKVIIVRLTSPPDPLEKLTEITGIESVTNLGEKRFRLGGNTNDTAGIIAGAAATNKWGLTELVSESTSLEQVYIQLTSGT